MLLEEEIDMRYVDSLPYAIVSAIEQAFERVRCLW